MEQIEDRLAPLYALLQTKLARLTQGDALGLQRADD